MVQFFYGYLLRVLQQNYKLQKGVYQKVDEKENVSPFAIFHRKWLKFASQKKVSAPSQEGQGYPQAGRSAPRDFAPSSPASPWKTPSIPPLLLGLTH